MRRILPILFLSLWIFCVQAQRPSSPSTFEITGKVVDKSSGIPLEYATVALANIKTPDQLEGGITDANGNFMVEVPQGVYNISVEYISFETFRISAKEIDQPTDLGTIKLGIAAGELDEVVVIAEKTTVDIRLDKKIYNVGKDLTVSGGTVSDVLDNVPSVSVDVEGNVELRGNGDVRILINGKPSALTGLNSTDALRQLPAESIERVEVITSPSARYDAEGSGGIINIILRRSKLQGLNGSIAVNGGYPWQAGINGNLNYRVGNVNLFTNSGYNYRESPGNSLTETRFNDGSFLREDREFDRSRQGYNSNFGIEWYVNETASITQTLFLRESDRENDGSNLITQIDENDVVNNTFRFTPELEDDRTIQYTANFNKQFEETGHSLTADFQYEESEEVEAALITQNGSDAEFNRTTEDQRRILLQTDYVRPVGEDGQFEFGYRGDFNTLISDYDVVFIDPTEEEIGFPNPSNVLDFTETINAIYSQYGNKFGKFSFLTGLRYENTKQVINQLETNERSINDFDGLFPTLNLNYEFTEKQSVQLGYNRRLRRPRSWFLNPFPSRSSATNLFQGNPALLPSFSNQVDLGYLNRMSKITLNSSIYFQRSTDVINFITIPTGEFVPIVVDDGNPNAEPQLVEVVQRSPVNLARNDRYGFEFTVTYRPTKKWNMNGNFNLFNNITRGDFNNQNFDAENLSWFIRLNNKYTLPGKVDWQTRVFYRGPTEDAQNRNEGIFTLSLAFSKDFFDEKASLALNVSDLFNSRIRRTETNIPGRLQRESEFQWRERSANLTFTYRFNQKKKRGRSGGDDDGDDGDFEG
ncbi:outer membrane beta-barrel family protein [Gangjinia marincola]|uniref:Outer membrane beta-barrel family protein n=1 Tax=Gangjinia marincola TaxID=578463 RepID=A0ABN1MCZ7_9FLAO